MKPVFRSNLFALILILLQIFGGLIISPILLLLKVPLSGTVVIGQVLLLVVPTIIYLFVTKLPIGETLSLRKLSWLNVLIVFGIALFIQPLALFLSALSTLAFNNDISEVVFQLNDLPLAVMIAIVAFTPSICEEITMRGVVLSGHKNVDIRKAAFVNGLFFGMLHLNGHQFLYAFVLGALFAYLVYITGSIFSSMLAHFVINGSQVLLSRLQLFLMGQTGVDPVELAASITLQEKLLTIISTFMFALILTPVCVLLIYALIRVNKKNMESRQNIESEAVNTDAPATAPPQEQIFNWPFYTTIAVFILFMAFLALLNFLISYLGIGY